MRPRWPGAVLLPAIAIAVALAAACGDGGDDASERPSVAASTGIIADLARHVAGSDAEVFAVIPAGADVHGFTASPDTARRIAEADAVLVNGYNLEASTLGVILENRRDDAPLVVVSEGIEPLAAGHEHGDEHDSDEHGDEHDGDEQSEDGDDLVRAEGDPHLWLSVRNAMIYVENIADALVEADIEHAAGYREREESYLAELQQLDEELRAAVAQIPRERRVLVVFHDAFQYFAADYGLELAAAVLPASASQQASAGDVAAIIELVRERNVPAVYHEPQFASQTLDAIAEETGAEVLTLYSGAFTDEVNSYVELMRANAAALVAGLAR